MKDTKKIPYLKILPMLIIAFILYKLIDNVDLLVKELRFFFSLISPFFWAFGIAYFLNPQMKYFEKRFKIKRVLSLIIVYVIFLGILSFTFRIVTPSLFKNAKQIVVDIPEYARSAEKFINKNADKLDVLDSSMTSLQLKDNLTQFVENSGKYLEVWFNLAVSKIIDFTSGFFKFVIGILISAYMLAGKERIIDKIKKIIRAILGNEKAEICFNFGVEVNNMFSKYIIGKFIDSAIIGVMCLVILKIIHSPYSVLISFVVGITNMIPYFGPFIGMIFGAIIVVFSSPIMALWVILAIFLLQQFDGWYLGPKILGDQVGLSPLLIIFAVVVGGGFFGVLGMFLGVPVIAVLKLVADNLIERRLNATAKEVEPQD